MQESMGRHQAEGIATTRRALAHDDTLGLGSFICALYEETEDEFDVDLRVRAFLESVWLGRVAGLAAFGEVPLTEAPIREN